jgi:hypothetical protein
MAASEDERMLWLSEAYQIIKGLDGQRVDVRMWSVTDIALLADRIATALQRAYERGKAAQSA